MHISIEEGKTLIIRLMAVGPVIEGRAQRDVWFEVNGEVRHWPIWPIGASCIADRWLLLYLGTRRLSRGQELCCRDYLARKGDGGSWLCRRTNVWRGRRGACQGGAGNQER